MNVAPQLDQLRQSLIQEVAGSSWRQRQERHQILRWLRRPTPDLPQPINCLADPSGCRPGFQPPDIPVARAILPVRLGIREHRVAAD